MNSVRKHHALIAFQPIEQRFVGLDMCDLRRLVRPHGQGFGFLVAEPKPPHQLDRPGLGIGDVEQFLDDGANLIGGLRRPVAKQSDQRRLLIVRQMTICLDTFTGRQNPGSDST